MKTEQEIRERIKIWEDMIRRSHLDLSPSLKTPLISIAAKVFTLKWVLGEGEDV